MDYDGEGESDEATVDDLDSASVNQADFFLGNFILKCNVFNRGSTYNNCFQESKNGAVSTPERLAQQVGRMGFINNCAHAHKKELYTEK